MKMFIERFCWLSIVVALLVILFLYISAIESIGEDIEDLKNAIFIEEVE